MIVKRYHSDWGVPEAKMNLSPKIQLNQFLATQQTLFLSAFVKFGGGGLFNPNLYFVTHFIYSIVFSAPQQNVTCVSKGYFDS